MPALPSPSSSLVLLRGHATLEVLLIQRHHASRVAAGDFVFPGGKLEAADAPGDAAAWCPATPAAEAARRLALEDASAALGYWVAAIREAFEEVGILLAYGPDGGLVRDGGPFMAYREACRRDSRVFREMLRAEGLTLATDRLVYFAHWITPEENPIRFETRFFAAATPPGQEPTPDDREITAVRWMTPAEALAARTRGEITLRLPTIKNLQLLAGEAHPEAVLARLGRRTVATIRPRILTDNGAPRTLLPGDAGYY
jgi:8-oxo-dGTP pyrophosphatase MutT (NUDIX family)